jgi:uncharacterized protein (DUF362 family)
MPLKNILRNINRRTFLKAASITGIAGLVFPRNLFASLAPTQLSRVVIVEDSIATSGFSIDAAVVQVMMDRGIMALSGQYDVGEAWKAQFPGINASSTIAIKLNCLNSRLPSHIEVTDAVVEGLKQMSFGGSPFPENNIIIYDNENYYLTACGYTINTSASGVRCFGTDSSGVGYSSETYTVNGSNQRISTIVTEMADYLINISCLKNHGIAGVTLCLKNHYGTCSSPSSMHGNYGNPYIPALNAVSPIRDKQCVNICDALIGMYSGGPNGSPQFAENKIIMSRDIVAVDYWGREILIDHGCSTIYPPNHVDTASQSPYNLGVSDPSQMDLVEITDPTPVEKMSWGSIKNLFSE